MKFLAVLALFIFFAGGEAAANEDETLATPRIRTPPAYPASCQPPSNEEAMQQRVIVRYGVTKDGQTEDVHVAESTDPCFEEAAVAAVRNWTYEPRRVNGKKQPQEDLEVTITFLWKENTRTEEFDARPIKRVPPQYPRACTRVARKEEVVTIKFDVTTEGTTENIRIVESTSRCLNKSATTAVSKWRYRPKTIDGEPVVRKDVVTAIRYQLSHSTPPDLEIRNGVRRKLKRVERILKKKDKDPYEAINLLNDIEEEYGDSFTRAELAAFHKLRGAARIEIGDYAGALDDLRLVQSSGLSGEASEAVDNAITQLEAAVAAQETAAAVSDNPASETEN